MGDNKANALSRRFAMECIPWGYETKRQLGWKNVGATEIETSAIVSTEPKANTDKRLAEKAKKMAWSVRQDGFRNCRFKRFLADAKEVFLPSAPAGLFAAGKDGMIRVRATWTKTARSGTDIGDIERTQRFAVPAIAGENPLDTARRLLETVKENGEGTPSKAITSADIHLVFGFSSEAVALIQETLRQKEREEKEAERRWAEAPERSEKREPIGLRGPGGLY